MARETLGHHPEQGRNYSIRYLDLVVDVFGSISDDAAAKRLKQQDQGVSVIENIQGFEALLDGMVKGDMRISRFDSISFSHPEGSIHDLAVGVLRPNLFPFPFDLHDDTGQVVIPRGTSVVHLGVDAVLFPTDRAVTVTAPMVTASLALVADYLRDHSHEDIHRATGLPYPLEYVIGLTHPRIGNAARRWGFQVSSHPFPPEVYDFIDEAAKANQEPDLAPDIQNLRSQVLVYLPMLAFLTNAPTGKQAV